MQDRFVVQKQPLAAQILLPFGIGLRRVLTRLELDHVAPARNIEHSGRLHGRSCPPLIRFQREQIQKHLQVLPVQQLCIIKILMAGLVIDDTEIAPSVRLIGVHAVNLPG